MPIEIQLACVSEPRQMMIVPDNTPREFSYANSQIAITVPLVEPHSVVVVE